MDLDFIFLNVHIRIHVKYNYLLVHGDDEGI